MSDNTGETTKEDFDLQVPKASAKDEVESAKILFQEGLLDEAKRILHRVLISHPGYRLASELLQEIRKSELDLILNRANSSSSKKKPEDPEQLIKRLESDLGIQIESAGEFMDPGNGNWIHSGELNSRGHFDLGIAFFEMGCYRDAERELEKALRRVRNENSELGDSGIAMVALRAEALLRLEEAFEAKLFLAPILNEPELTHEGKLPLYYLAGRAEEMLENRVEARAWLEKVLEIDPLFRDANFRIRLL